MLPLGLVNVRRPPSPLGRAFVRTVVAREPITRNAWVERLILAGWLVIVAKNLLVIWAIDHWAVPFHPYWINVPTILMAALATVVYFRRNRG